MISFLSAFARDKEAQQIPLGFREICASYLQMCLWTKVASAYWGYGGLQEQYLLLYKEDEISLHVVTKSQDVLAGMPPETWERRDGVTQKEKK